MTKVTDAQLAKLFAAIFFVAVALLIWALTVGQSSPVSNTPVKRTSVTFSILESVSTPSYPQMSELHAAPPVPVCGDDVCELYEGDGSSAFACVADCKEKIQRCNKSTGEIETLFETASTCTQNSDCKLWNRDHRTPWACRSYNKSATKELETLIDTHLRLHQCPQAATLEHCENREAICIRNRCVTK